MNGYTCTKACTFGGVAYSIGDAIPFEAVLPSREKALIKQGIIAPVINPEELLKENKALQAKIAEFEKGTAIAQEPPTGDKSEQNNIVIPITAKGGVLKLTMTPDDIIKAVTIMQLNAEAAAKAVGEIKKEETLILIDTLDTRKTVKTAIMARVEEIKNGKEGDNKEDKGQGDA